MSALVRLTPQFFAARKRVRLEPGSSVDRALGATIGALARAKGLPDPLDCDVIIPPVREAHARRVPNENLWILYVLRPGEVWLVGLLTTPPVPRNNPPA